MTQNVLDMKVHKVKSIADKDHYGFKQMASYSFRQVPKC
jgi:hypothetical protein